MKFLVLTVALIAAAQAVSYSVSITTQSREWSGTGGGIYATLIGSNGAQLALGMLAQEFPIASTISVSRDFGVDLGDLACLVLSAGSDDAVMLDSVSVSSDGSAKLVNGGNADSIWLSTDTSEGVIAKMWCA